MKKNIMLKILVMFLAITIIGIKPVLATKEELTKEYTKSGQAATEDWLRVFNKIDKNGNGKLTANELKDADDKDINVLSKIPQAAAVNSPAIAGKYRDNVSAIATEYQTRLNSFNNEEGSSSNGGSTGGESDTTVGDTIRNLDIETSVYNAPRIEGTGRTAAGSLNDMISDAESFANQGQIQYNEGALQSFSSLMFNIFSIVGAAVALIVGIIIGIKYMMGSTEEKANYKQMLVPYLIGCFIVFSAFGIWKLVITILEGM